jgi:EAL domain-containing protein (putative c-di-GMP-specific phosphodiesterase class I)
MEIRLLRRSALEQDLPHAVARGELDLAFQPVMDLPSGRLVGVEALLRWRHRGLGTVPPAELLPVAEDLGLIGELGEWVLHWACRRLSAWRRDHEGLWLAVNARPTQLCDQGFLAAVPVALEAAQVPASALVIEVAEPDLVAVREGGLVDVVDNLGHLRSLGVRTAVDNFGTGPTSLSQLRVLPVDLLKIDRDVFGQPAGRAGQPGAIIDVLVKLGRQLGIEVVAQGLETPADLETVRAAGCRLGQGHLLGHPMPAEHLEALLDRYRNADL